MTKTFLKVCVALAAVVAAAQAQQFSSKYFDCWMENVAHVNADEIQRLGIKTYGDAWICGCFNVEDTEGEDWQEAAAREMHEETGLVFSPVRADLMYQEARFTTVGMTDESCATVYGYAQGRVSSRYLDEGEEIEVVLADREEVRRILREEKVAIMCAYQLMHFLHDADPFAFLRDDENTCE